MICFSLPAESTVTAAGVDIGNHLFNGVFPSDNHDHTARSCYGGIKQVSRQKHRRTAYCGHDDDGKFAALTFVDRDTVRQLQIIHIAALVGCRSFIIELHLHDVFLRVDKGDKADIAVENALPVLDADCAVFLPFELVVVAGLHDLVALAEGRVAADTLMLAGSRRIEFCLKQLVEHPYAAFALLGWGKHLHLAHGVKIEETGKPCRAKRDNAFCGVGGGNGTFKKEIAPLCIQTRGSPRLIRWAL